MVAHDREFKVDLRKLSEDELMEKRQRFFSRLYDGEYGSRDNVEKQSLIDAIDRELDRRHKKGGNKRATIAIGISIVALLISLAGFGIDLWEKILSKALM